MRRKHGSLRSGKAPSKPRPRSHNKLQARIRNTNGANNGKAPLQTETPSGTGTRTTPRQIALLKRVRSAAAEVMGGQWGGGIYHGIPHCPAPRDLSGRVLPSTLSKMWDVEGLGAKAKLVQIHVEVDSALVPRTTLQYCVLSRTTPTRFWEGDCNLQKITCTRKLIAHEIAMNYTGTAGTIRYQNYQLVSTSNKLKW